MEYQKILSKIWITKYLKTTETCHPTLPASVGPSLTPRRLHRSRHCNILLSPSHSHYQSSRVQATTSSDLIGKILELVRCHQHNPVTVLLHHLPIALTRTNKEFYQIFQVSQDDATEDHALHLAYWVPTISEYLLSIILEESCEESCHTAFTYLAFLTISSLLSALYNEAFTYVRISSLSQHQDGLLYHHCLVSFGFKEKWF